MINKTMIMLNKARKIYKQPSLENQIESSRGHSKTDKLYWEVGYVLKRCWSLWASNKEALFLSQYKIPMQDKGVFV